MLSKPSHPVPGFQTNGHRFWTGRCQDVATAIVLFALTASLSGCCTFRNEVNEAEVNRARSLTSHALTALHHGQSARAVSLLKEASQASPQDQRIRQHLAQAMLSEGDIDQAIDQLKQAVLLADADPWSHVELGELYLRKKQPKIALAQAEKALQRNRQLPQAWLLLGKSQRELGDSDAALASLHRAAGYEAEPSVVQVEIARTYRRIGKNFQALNALELYSQRFSPEQVPLEVVHLVGQTLTDLQQYERATMVLVNATEQPGAAADVWLSLSRAQKLAGDLSNARLTALTAVQRFPRNDDVRSWSKSLEGYVAENVQARVTR